MAETSIFEVARQSHEEVERYIQAATDLLSSSSSLPLRKEHQASKMLDQIVSRNFSLLQMYRDASGDVDDEMQKLNSDVETEPLSEFYNRLSKIRDYHKKYPNTMPDVFSVELDDGTIEGIRASDDTAPVDSVARLFSGEEMGGRFLDLYSHHDNFLNLKGVRRITYLQYMDQFDKLQGDESKIPKESKKTDAYKTYLKALQAYLLTFLRRTRPLTDIDMLEITALASFEEDWDHGRIPGWESKGEEWTGMSREKDAHANGEGIWCEVCKRSFARQTVFDAHLKGQKHLKAAQRLQGEDNNGTVQCEQQSASSSHISELEVAKRQARAKAIARDEAVIVALGKELLGVRTETRANVERRSALTDKERQAEAEAAALEFREGGMSNGDAGARKSGTAGGGGGDGDEGDEDDEKIYNPLKLPIGWDGKPIPFWLYKLHGLSVEFRCEICSDYIYQGRKNFERHFAESRHAFGLRALGLPNTKHFHEITRIEDALTLADKLKKQGKIAAEEQEAEEVEDEHGNTYTKKTYELLKRQGLI